MQRLSKKIAKWLTETAQKSTTRWINEILGCMDPEIVADVIADEEGFDLDLYLDFCPNWDGK